LLARIQMVVLWWHGTFMGTSMSSMPTSYNMHALW
jgi:hypothetical protein